MLSHPVRLHPGHAAAPNSAAAAAVHDPAAFKVPSSVDGHRGIKDETPLLLPLLLLHTSQYIFYFPCRKRSYARETIKNFKAASSLSLLSRHKHSPDRQRRPLCALVRPSASSALLYNTVLGGEDRGGKRVLDRKALDRTILKLDRTFLVQQH